MPSFARSQPLGCPCAKCGTWRDVVWFWIEGRQWLCANCTKAMTPKDDYPILAQLNNAMVKAVRSGEIGVRPREE